MFEKRRVTVIPLSECLEEKRLSYSSEENYEDIAFTAEVCSRFTGTKRQVVEFLCEGYNLFEITKKLGIDKHKVYEIKKELKMDLADLYDDAFDLNAVNTKGDMAPLIEMLKIQSRDLSLREFADHYINEYDPEAVSKGWKAPPIQDVYYEIWEQNIKSCTKAPREHLKTISVIEYIIKKLFEREYPIEVNYFHLDGEIATSKLRKLQMMVERNTILKTAFGIDQAKNWKDGEIRLQDGTQIIANGFGSGAVGKHPHMIILDDIIDRKVIYSDKLNEKAIGKFYSDIYPMISKAGEDKKIIVIGTSQREDDIYEKLPKDFARHTFQAIINEEAHKVLEPQLFSWDELMKIKADISEEFGERYWLKEYMNVPYSAIGMIIKPEWIKTYVTPPENLEIYDAWDLSPGKDIEKGDYTAGVRIGILKDSDMHKLKIYVLWVKKERVEFGERLKLLTASGQEGDPLAIGVEQNVFQYDTVKTLKDQTNLPIVGIQTIKNKIEKFQTELAPHFENGKVYIRADMTDLKQELLALPVGLHDDQADALTIAIKLSGQASEPIIDFL